MCLAIPMRLESVSGDLGIVDIGGVKRRIGLTLLENPKIGEYLLVHAGFAIQRLDEKEAKETLKLLEELMNNEISR